MPLILVVDDTALFREPIAAALEAQGYRTLCAADGREAIALATAHQPDLVLLDIFMPGIDGLTVLRALRADNRCCRTRVLMLTNAGDRHNVVKAAKLGTNGYMLKVKLSLKDMLARVRKVLEEPPVTETVARAREERVAEQAAATPDGDN